MPSGRERDWKGERLTRTGGGKQQGEAASPGARERDVCEGRGGARVVGSRQRSEREREWIYMVRVCKRKGMDRCEWGVGGREC